MTDVKGDLPGVIDNSSLFKANSDDLREFLSEEADYYLVPLSTWGC